MSASSIARNYFPFREVKLAFADMICASVQAVYSKDVVDMKEAIAKAMTPPKHAGSDLGFPCFLLGKRVGVKNPAQIAAALGADIKTRLGASTPVSEAVSAGPFINVNISTGFLAEALLTDAETFLSARPVDQKAVMIEYSQPNTHKAFHVGHMRNVALGDALVKMYSHSGYPVTAANYFGDEGAHIAHCLWLLKQQIARGEVDLASVAELDRGEFLGERYSHSVMMLDMTNYTSLPFPGMFAAKVLEVTNHPDPEAPANWHKVLVQHGPNEDQKATVICGGADYKEGDIIAYVRVGGKYKGKDVIEKDMKGVTSCGVIMGRAELGLKSLKPQEEKKGGKKKNKKKSKHDKSAAAVANEIFVLPADTPIGKELPEIGRFPNGEGKDAILGPIPEDQTVVAALQQRKDEVI